VIPVGRLRKVSLREVWPNEVRDFSLWLAENLEVLGDALGFRLSLEQKEGKVGPFAVDLMARDDQGNVVVVENQLGKTDHDHLGKILTYMVNLEAKRAVWLTSDPRPEHGRVVEWLNEVTPLDTAIYLVRVEACCIGDSPVAPLFSVIAGPNGKDIGRGREDMAERHRLRFEFWENLIDRIKSRGVSLHASLSSSSDNWLQTGAGKAGLVFMYRITMDRATAELVIDRGAERAGETRRIFEELHSKKEEIEQGFGGPLVWDSAEGRRSHMVKVVLDRGGLKDRASWPEIQGAMVDAMVRLEKALGPRIRALTL